MRLTAQPRLHISQVEHSYAAVRARSITAGSLADGPVCRLCGSGKLSALRAGSLQLRQEVRRGRLRGARFDRLLTFSPRLIGMGCGSSRPQPERLIDGEQRMIERRTLNKEKKELGASESSEAMGAGCVRLWLVATHFSAVSL
jgi:hypothetical protein